MEAHTFHLMSAKFVAKPVSLVDSFHLTHPKVLEEDKREIIIRT